MSEKVINDINSNGSETHKNCTDEVDSCSDAKGNDQSELDINDDINTENNGQTEHNLANNQECSTLKDRGPDFRNRTAIKDRTYQD